MLVARLTAQAPSLDAKGNSYKASHDADDQRFQQKLCGDGVMVCAVPCECRFRACVRPWSPAEYLQIIFDCYVPYSVIRKITKR